MDHNTRSRPDDSQAADLLSLRPPMELSRRGVIVTSLAAGFALVLVVQEIFGVHEHIRDICRRFAKLGALAVAPELYARQGDVSKITNIRDIMPIVSKVPDAQVMADLDATVAWAKGTGKGDVKHLGITGFCWGGRIVWLYAAHNPQLRAAVAWYGRLDGKTTDLQPQNPLDLVDQVHAPVLGLYAGRDQGIPASDVEKMREALKKAGKKAEIVVYPDAQHGFNADYRPSYNATDAQDGWMLLFRHGSSVKRTSPPRTDRT
jgi:carboxymethylenebutenolidase